MGQFVKETAHLKTDPDKFSEGWERIFGKKEECSCKDVSTSFDMTCEYCGRNMNEKKND